MATTFTPSTAPREKSFAWTVARKPLEPPASLQRQAKVIFHEIVASVDPKHFRECDVPLVASLAVAIHMVRFYASLIGEEDHPTAFRAWTDAVSYRSA
jgi:hypothetical protein